MLGVGWWSGRECGNGRCVWVGAVADVVAGEGREVIEQAGEAVRGSAVGGGAC